MARLFFAFDIEAVYPEDLPKGRILTGPNRHFTLVFLGDQDKNNILNSLFDMPTLPFEVSKVGFFDKVLFIPENHPRLVAWHATYLEGEDKIRAFQKELDYSGVRRGPAGFNAPCADRSHQDRSRHPFPRTDAASHAG